MTLVLEDMNEQPATLKSLVSRAQAGEFTAARNIVLPARIRRVAGIGSSRHAAGLGAAAFEICAGVPSTVLAAAGAGVPLPYLDPRDVVITVSQSGETDALLSTARRARDAAVPVVAVVNAATSALGDIATVAIDCAAGPERVVAATKSVTAQALTLRLLARDIDTAITDAFLAAISSVLADGAVEALLPRTEPATIVSSGFGAQWIADEVALKFAEVAGRTLAAESLVDYLHGPVATGTAALALLRHDANAAAVEGLGHVHVVDLDALAAPCGDPCLDAIVAVVAGQRLAVAWAQANGEDPDAPRGLSKVTRTR